MTKTHVERRGVVTRRMGLAALLGVLALIPLMTATGGEDMTEQTRILVDFGEEGENGRWRVINDDVMGGVSQSGMAITPDSVAVFEGNLSLDNNGGFASVRRLPQDYKLFGFHGILLRVNGDGRKYQFRVRTNEGFDGVSYRAEFKTDPGKWMTVTIPFSSLEPTFRGRLVPGAPKLKAEDIRQIGFLLGDKREGRFRIEIDWIKACQLQSKE